MIRTSFLLEFYYEEPAYANFAAEYAGKLKTLVDALAPHICLTIQILPAKNIVRWSCCEVNAPKIDPSSRDRQSLLMTEEGLGGYYGFGAADGYCCVSRLAMQRKLEKGGDPTDILIHEWLHTLCGKMINGECVPFADHAERFGFQGVKGPDGEDTWNEFYRCALDPVLLKSERR